MTREGRNSGPERWWAATMATALSLATLIGLVAVWAPPFPLILRLYVTVTAVLVMSVVVRRYLPALRSTGTEGENGESAGGTDRPAE